MKTTDLMIGDWVCFDGDENHECPVRIDAINTEDAGVEGDYYDVWEPIPLTPEILEKNGFEVSSEHARYYFEEDGEKYEFVLRKMYYINDRKKQKGWSFYAFNVLSIVDYVHELQHALKLCGIKKEIAL